MGIGYQRRLFRSVVNASVATGRLFVPTHLAVLEVTYVSATKWMIGRIKGGTCWVVIHCSWVDVDEIYI